jgi:hypothetical protein
MRAGNCEGVHPTIKRLPPQTHDNIGGPAILNRIEYVPVTGRIRTPVKFEE